MARIKQTFETGKSVVEMRTFIDSRVLTRPELSLLLDAHRWEGATLHASGKLGSGTIVLEHGKVHVDIELTLFGAAAQGTIEAKLAEQFKRLGSGS
ncbi:MAG: polyhydroxyalkanoic acid system family protein [Candidatus Kapabacteria bacterium]|nr:polyhydroxyalkanoic acid system family protein [Candidatus Kapabacteria bacterium]